MSVCVSPHLTIETDLDMKVEKLFVNKVDKKPIQLPLASDLNKEVRDECFFNSEFQNHYKDEFHDTPDYFKSEEIDAEIGLHETVSCWNETEKKKHQIKAECAYAVQSSDCEIKSEDDVDKADTTVFADIKSEEKIDIKYESVEKFTYEEMTREKSSKNISRERHDLSQQENLLLLGNYRHILEHNYSLNIDMFASEEERTTLFHRDVSDQIHTCVTCNFEAKSRPDLEKHMLIHVNLSQRKMYKCALCDFTTHWNGSLKHHQLTHEDLADVNIYTCAQCEYRTKRKGNLAQHVLVHENPSEMKMYKCALCNLTTKYKHNLDSHTLTHLDSTEKKTDKSDMPSCVNMYKCDQCRYISKWKGNFVHHIVQVHGTSSIRHRNETEDTNIGVVTDLGASKKKRYKCELCDYMVYFKYSLNKHLLVHKNVSEADMYACNKCGFKTKWKYNLTQHQSIHEDLSKKKLYKCTKCKFRTKNKYYIKVHMSKH